MDPACLTQEELQALAERTAPSTLQERARHHFLACTTCPSNYAAIEAACASSPAPAVADPATSWRPPRQVEEFRVDEALGSGAFGVVCRAWDTRLERPVAIKFLTAPMNDALRTSFENEARALARLNHPNIVILHRTGEVASSLFMVSELIQGQALDQLEGPRPAAEVLRIGKDIARGLAEAHRRRVYHRDLKPANLIRTEDGTIKILDFGLAKLGDQAESLQASMNRVTDPHSSRRVVGTPLYMAPEIWRGEVASERADLYSLGAVLYQLSSGRPPFSAPNEKLLNELVQTASYPPLRSAAPGCPRALARVIEQCLERDPQRRPPSARAVLARLEAASQPRLGLWAALLCGVLLGGGLYWYLLRIASPALPPPPPRPTFIVHPGGRLLMGSDDSEIDAFFNDYQRDGGRARSLAEFRRLFVYEKPTHAVRVSRFKIATTEVSNREFARWLNQTVGPARLRIRARRVGDSTIADPFLYWEDRYPLLDLLGMPGFGLRLSPTLDAIEVIKGREEHPVTQVTWWGAQLYCQDLGMRLLTEAEYELAVRGEERRTFPWRDGELTSSCADVAWQRRPREVSRRRCPLPLGADSEFLRLSQWRARFEKPGAEQACPQELDHEIPGQPRDQACATESTDFAAVGTSRRDRTPERIHDLAGNAEEWVIDAYVFYQETPMAPLDPVAVNAPPSAAERRVVRGGHRWQSSARSRGAARTGYLPDEGPQQTGFRCAVRVGAADPLVTLLPR